MSEEESNDSNGIANLRKQYDELKKQNEALAAEVGEFRSAKRTASVADILKAKGLSEKAAALYAGEDTSEDAVGKWIEQYADVFGAQPDQNEKDAQRVSASSFGTDAGTTQNTQAGVVGDPAELLRQIQTLPYEELVKNFGFPPRNAI